MCADAKWPSLSVFLAVACFLLPSKLGASVTAEEVSQKLVEAFAKGAGIRSAKSTITDQSHIGFRTRTVKFAIGPRVYRVVFSPDGMVTITSLNEGDLSAVPLWTRRADRVTVDEIVNVIYSRELGRTFGSAQIPKSSNEAKADVERELVRSQADLRWNELLNRLLHGDSFGLGGFGSLDANFARAAAIGRAADPCGNASGGLSPERAAISDVAQAMAAARSSSSEAFADRSRQYEKKKSTSLSSDLQSYRETVPEETFRLIQDTGANTTDLFRRALTESDKTASDPFSLAANRNFKEVIGQLGQPKAAALVGSTLGMIVVDVTEFLERRKLAPGASVIFDRQTSQYFVDPTFNSPAEARYLLSLATWYEAQRDQYKLISQLANYNETQKKISELEHATLGENDERELAAQRKESDVLTTKLFEIADHLQKDPAYAH